MITQEDLQELARIIIENIRKDFELKHLSKNLINTIYVTELDGEIKIHIPAETYKMFLYMRKGVVVHDGKGSYANTLNEHGSEIKFGKYDLHPGNHKGYVDEAINKALITWSNGLKKRYTMTIM